MGSSNEQGVSLIQGYEGSCCCQANKGARIFGTLTRWEYKMENGKVVKCKVHMTVRGDQQVEGKSFDPADLYAPVLKHYEASLLNLTTSNCCRGRLSCLQDRHKSSFPVLKHGQ